MRKLVVLLVFVSLVLTACATDVAPNIESDSGQKYSITSIPVDDNVYVIQGEIVGDIDSLVQVNAQGSTSGSMYGGYGYVGGSFAMWQEGKGFVRLLVKTIDPPSELANPGDLIIVKTTDQKIRALLPGDAVTFKCRVQYEAVAAVRYNETADVEKVETWEFDYCRMVVPKIGTNSN